MKVGHHMYSNRTKEGKNNICGERIKKFRKSLPQKTSQQKLAEMLCLLGLDVDKNVIQRIESGERFVTDIELRYIAEALNVTFADLLDDEDDVIEIAEEETEES